MSIGMLGSLFRAVDESFVKSNQGGTFRFLERALQHYKIDVSEYAICSHPSGSQTHINERIISITPRWEAAPPVYQNSFMRYEVLHELRHIVQGQLNKLSYNDENRMYTWVPDKGKKVTYGKDYIESLIENGLRLQYNKLLHEKDANKFAMMSEFCANVVFPKVHEDLMRMSGAIR